MPYRTAASGRVGAVAVVGVAVTVVVAVGVVPVPALALQLQSPPVRVRIGAWWYRGVSPTWRAHPVMSWNVWL